MLTILMTCIFASNTDEIPEVGILYCGTRVDVLLRGGDVGRVCTRPSSARQTTTSRSPPPLRPFQSPFIPPGPLSHSLYDGSSF